jgi:lysophospholipase L1-like esterase
MQNLLPINNSFPCLCLFLMLHFTQQCQSQNRPPLVEITNKDTVGYSFVRSDDNRLENTENLQPFLQKLYEQRVIGGKKINIVHIGDSHILGNFMTREVRARLQRSFGDAGRGVIFPYRVAGTGGPTDYLMDTNCKWSSSNIQKDRSAVTSYGISGFSLNTGDENGCLSLRLRDTSTSDNRLFSKITVFHNNKDAAFDLQIKDEQGGQSGQLIIENARGSAFYFDRPTDQAKIMIQKNGNQSSLELAGINLENELSGVIYHSIGINGARFSDFTRSNNFVKQVSDLFPDLVVLSFGTNEANDPNVNNTAFYRQIDQLVKKIQEESPWTVFLLTTPADSYLRGKGFNPNMAEISSVIRKYALENGHALWDLYGITGGLNSAQSWKRNGLMAGDSIHYSKTGYAVQGKLFYQSLVKAYNEQVK